MYTKLAGGKLFTKLDLSSAYLHLPLDLESRRYTTINTHKGLFQYNRLPFGVASAPAIFQRFMDTLLQGIPNVSVYIDNILISGSTLEEHLTTLDRVLQKLQETGLHCNRDKCLFLQTSLEFLGHRISAEGIRPTEEKVRAIHQAPEPKNVTELRSFLGILNYYAKFLPNLSSRLFPLCCLTNTSLGLGALSNSKRSKLLRRHWEQTLC